ncbi:regulator of chromosome condensation [Anaeramoeba flamelloides]|uniref:Regulator of chromosome condensation n=1 Tax=Anaeramoeba flamelloides TaxID=1746091 RepID=A0AAV8AE81_9EUKA|nr:regulator of chromosome condensation [Anaeramoeba flamelloides]
MGEVYTIGDNTYGSLGYHDHRKLRIINKIELSEDDQTLMCSNSRNSSCFLLGSGVVYRFNENFYFDDLKLQDVVQIVSAVQHSLALTGEGKVYAWSMESGTNYYGFQKLNDPEKPLLLEDLTDKGITSIHVTNESSLFLNELNGNLYASGVKNRGLCLCNSSNKNNIKLQLVQTNVERVFTGYSFHGFIEKTNGEIEGFGNNEENQLGIAKKTNQTPHVIPELTNLSIKSISVGEKFSMVLTTDGKILSSGNKESISTRNNQTQFTGYIQLNDIFMVQINSGASFAVSLSEGGDVWVFGIWQRKDNIHPRILTKFVKPCTGLQCTYSTGVWFYCTRNTINEDLFNLYKNGYVSDCKIKNIPLHKCLLESRLKKSFNEICQILENITDKEIMFLMNWVYSDEIKTNPKKIIELLLLFEIKNISKHKLSQDLKQLLNNEESMDFKLLIPDLENNDDEDEGKSFEEIPVHKFILSARSGLFREMFQNVEKTENQVQDYSGKSMETMELLINHFYTGNFDLTADNDINFISEELQDVQDYYQLNPNSSFYTKFQQLTKRFN